MAPNQRLKAARVLRAMTQRELGDRVGLLEIDISRFETGRSNPDEETKKRIATVLNKPTFEIFDN